MKHPEGVARWRGPLSFARSAPGALALVATLGLLAGPALAVEPVQLSFGRIAIDAPLEQTIEFDNPTAGPLSVARLRLSPPLTAPRLSSEIPAGGRGSFTLALGEPRRPGPFEGLVVVEFSSDEVEPLVFEVRGYLVPEVELLPRSFLVLSTLRDQPKEGSVEIVVHREQPVALAIAAVEGEGITARLETEAEGRRYRLVARNDGTGPGGRRQGLVRLRADDDDVELPVLIVLSLVVDRVRTFPEAVDFGALQVAWLREEGAAERLAQTLMVYRSGVPGFEIEAVSRLPFVLVEAERGPEGDQWELTLRLDPATAPVGEIAGELVVTTNDEEFPRLVVPLTGRIGAVGPSAEEE